MSQIANVREGYPVVDEASPLWVEQQAGWPKLAAHEAWREALLEAKSGYVNSSSHPAYDPGYIVNKHATRPGDDPVSPGESKGERR